MVPHGLFKIFRTIIGPLAVVGRVLWNRVRPSCPGVFLNFIIIFSEFWHAPRNPYEVVRDRAGFSGKNLFAPKFGKMDQTWAKNKVLNLLKGLVINFYWICSIMKTYHLLCSCTGLIFGKIFVSEIWFFACWYKFTWSKIWSKMFWVDMVKNGRGQSGYRTLKLTVSQQ